VPSTSTGGLPGPAQMARLPLAMAARTTPGPPVTQRMSTSPDLQMAPKVSRVGVSTMATRFSMPVSLRMARLMARMASAAHLAPPGWGLTTRALPAAPMLTMLEAMVGMEWVTGVTTPMTPQGACSSKAMPRSPL